MIRESFSVFDGIGPGRERAIRAAGITTWDALLAAGSIAGISAKLQASAARQVHRWSRALAQEDVAFFAEHMPRAEHWRLFDVFGDGACYLDIETTGLSPGYHDVTMVGLCRGGRFTALVRGQGLSAAAVSEALASVKILVTYYGSAIDVPFLQASLPGIDWTIPHFDLCFAGRRVGLAGGLKQVEQSLGMHRDAAIAEVDGFEAVRLWRRYQRGDAGALQTLIDYNEADTRNLATIAQTIHARLCEKARL